MLINWPFPIISADIIGIPHEVNLYASSAMASILFLLGHRLISIGFKRADDEIIEVGIVSSILALLFLMLGLWIGVSIIVIGLIFMVSTCTYQSVSNLGLLFKKSYWFLRNRLILSGENCNV